MPEFFGTIGGFTNNSYIGLRWTVSGVPAGSTIATGELIIKPTETSSDSASIIDKTITPSNVAGTGQVEDVGSTGVGIIRFDMPPSDTVKLIPGTKYTYWVEIVLNTSEKTIVEKGTIFAEQGSEHA